MTTKSKKSKNQMIQEHVMSSAPVPRCIYCGADEDDAFVAREPCVERDAEPKDLGAEGQNGQVEFNGSQYELTRADFQMIADALDIVNPDSTPAIKRAFKLTRIFSQLAGTKRPKSEPAGAKRQMIEINVEGGVIQDVLIPKGSNVSVIVRDYDVDGTEDESLSMDRNGDKCVISEYEA